jgi:hypothetical protein
MANEMYYKNADGDIVPVARPTEGPMAGVMSQIKNKVVLKAPKEPNPWDGTCRAAQADGGGCELYCGIPNNWTQKQCRHPDARVKYAQIKGLPVEQVFGYPFPKDNDGRPMAHCPLARRAAQGIVLGAQFKMDAFGRVGWMPEPATPVPTPNEAADVEGQVVIIDGRIYKVVAVM